MSPVPLSVRLSVAVVVFGPMIGLSLLVIALAEGPAGVLAPAAGALLTPALLAGVYLHRRSDIQVPWRLVAGAAATGLVFAAATSLLPGQTAGTIISSVYGAVVIAIVLYTSAWIGDIRLQTPHKTA